MKIAKEQKVVTVDRATWLTGDIASRLQIASVLLHPSTGLMCCLGFACEQAGFVKEQLANKPTPDSLHYLGASPPDWLRAHTNDQGAVNDIPDRMMMVNDDSSMKPRTRERKLIQLAAEAGVTLKFIGRRRTPAALSRLCPRT